ncbi:MAG: hypothetical protein WCD79_19125 [Chthoniobacteraceae bacterium]
MTRATFAHESPIDHVERELRFWVEGGRLHLSYRVQQSERAILMQLHKMDTDGDGMISEAERGAYFTAQAQKIAGLLKLDLDGRPLAFSPAGTVQLDARLGETFEFTTPLPVLNAGRHPGHMLDGYSWLYPGPFRWIDPGAGNQKDIRVEPVVQPVGDPTLAHPAWLDLKFEIVVP